MTSISEFKTDGGLYGDPPLDIFEKVEVRYRPATLHDELHVTTLFSRMLRELEPLGHDVLPTHRNVESFWQLAFRPAIEHHLHGILLAFAGDACIGATFYIPELNRLDIPPKRINAYGLYVDPEWRRQGVATNLQGLVHEHLRRLGFTSIVSHVLTNNEAALANCRRVGYTCIGHVVSYNLEEVSDG